MVETVRQRHRRLAYEAAMDAETPGASLFFDGDTGALAAAEHLGIGEERRAQLVGFEEFLRRRGWETAVAPLFAVRDALLEHGSATVVLRHGTETCRQYLDTLSVKVYDDDYGRARLVGGRPGRTLPVDPVRVRYRCSRRCGMTAPVYLDALTAAFVRAVRASRTEIEIADIVRTPWRD